MTVLALSVLAVSVLALTKKYYDNNFYDKVALTRLSLTTLVLTILSFNQVLKNKIFHYLTKITFFRKHQFQRSILKWNDGVVVPSAFQKVYHQKGPGVGQ